MAYGPKNVPHEYPLGTGANPLYIHSRWLNFEHTMDVNKQTAQIGKFLDIMKKNFKQYLKKELAYYEAAEKAFFAQVLENAKKTNNSKLIAIASDRDKLLKYINEQFEKEIKKKGSPLYMIDIAKNKISLYQMQWYKDWNVNGNKKLENKQFKKYVKIIPKILDGLEKSIDIISRDSNLEIIYNYKGSDHAIEKNELDDSLSVLQQRVVSITGKTTKIKEIKNIIEKQKAKTQGSGITQKNIREILNILISIMEEVYVAIHSKFGLLAEKYMKDFMDTIASGILVDKSSAVVGQEYASYNIMDVRMMSLTTQTYGNIEIGFSQKFRNKAEFHARYQSTDVFKVLSDYGRFNNATLAKSIPKYRPTIKYFRRNIISLKTFSLENKQSIPKKFDKFIDIEKDLALMRGVSRFFNQYLTMADETKVMGDSNKSLAYNVILSLRQGVFWMKDFIDVAYAAISKVNKGKIKAKGFDGSAKIRNFGKENKQRLVKLWREKLKILQEYEKMNEEISYDDIYKRTAEVIKKISQGNIKLIDSVTYTLDPDKFKK